MKEPLKIIDLIREHGPISSKDAAQLLDVSRQQVIDGLIKLVDADLIIPDWQYHCNNPAPKEPKWEVNPKPQITALEDEEITLMRRKLRLGKLLDYAGKLDGDRQSIQC